MAYVEVSMSRVPVCSVIKQSQLELIGSDQMDGTGGLYDWHVRRKPVAGTRRRRIRSVFSAEPAERSVLTHLAKLCACAGKRRFCRVCDHLLSRGTPGGGPCRARTEHANFEGFYPQPADCFPTPSGARGFSRHGPRPKDTSTKAHVRLPDTSTSSCLQQGS
jgi:hypothetical protein